MSSVSIFLSHNSDDKEFVRRLADDLCRAGVTVWVDEAEIRIGDSIIGKIGEGIHGCNYLGVVLSPSSVASPWVMEELRTALHYQVAMKGKTVLPLLYKHCEIPPFLVDKLYGDFTEPERYEFVLRQVLSRLDSRFSPPLFVSRFDLQFLLDQLPIPAPRPVLRARDAEDDVDYVTANAVDLSEFEARVAWPKRKTYAALRELIESHKVEIFLLRGVIDNNHPDIPACTKVLLPMVFRGLLPPNLRSEPEEVARLLRDLEAG